MTPENLLLTAISALTAALIFVCKILWAKSENCENDRKELHTEVAAVRAEFTAFVREKTEVLVSALSNNTRALELNTKLLTRRSEQASEASEVIVANTRPIPVTPVQ